MLCVRALFEKCFFSVSSRGGRKSFLSLLFSDQKYTDESLIRDTPLPFFMRRETTTTMRDNSQEQRRGRRNEQLWRIFAFLYLFVLCGCCTTSAVLSALFLFVRFSPSESSFLHFCLVLLALVAPPVVLKTDFFSKRAWRRKAERRGS